MLFRPRYLLTALAGTLLVSGTLTAQAIIGATGATVNAGGPGFGQIANTFNQAGLLTGYVSGITSFDAFVQTALHDQGWQNNEWFSNKGESSARVTYDLGGPMVIDRVALWNEDFAGIGSLNLLYSLDGINFTTLLSNLAPTNNPVSTNYLADVFSFGAISAKYVQFDMSGCAGDGYNFCGIGEVAFRTGALSEPSIIDDDPDGSPIEEVPEPSAFLLTASGLAALAFIRRRRRA